MRPSLKQPPGVVSPSTGGGFAGRSVAARHLFRIISPVLSLILSLASTFCSLFFSLPPSTLTVGSFDLERDAVGVLF